MPLTASLQVLACDTDSGVWLLKQAPSHGHPMTPDPPRRLPHPRRLRPDGPRRRGPGRGDRRPHAQERARARRPTTTPATKAFFFGGGIVGSVQVDPADIVKQEKRMRAEGGDPKVADAPAAPATAPAPAAPGVGGPGHAAPADPAAAPGTAPAGGDRRSRDPGQARARGLQPQAREAAARDQALRGLPAALREQHREARGRAERPPAEDPEYGSTRIDRARFDLDTAPSRATPRRRTTTTAGAATTPRAP